MTKMKKGFTYLFLSLCTIVSVFPFIWMIIGATNTSSDVIKGKLSFGSALMDNLTILFETTNMGSAIVNSAIISILTTVIALFISSLAGYAFEVYRTKMTDLVSNILLLSMMVPFAAIMIPLYRLFGKMHLLNSYAAVIAPATATAFLIFFFRQNSKMFPTALLEAGRIDGLNEVQLFTRIYFPTMGSTYAAAAIITFMTSWNSYVWPLVILQSNEKLTLPLIISSLSSSYTPEYGVIMVAIVIATLPIALVFFLLQKHFVQGMVGSVK